jgi:hypothetical protein
MYTSFASVYVSPFGRFPCNSIKWLCHSRLPRHHDCLIVFSGTSIAAVRKNFLISSL